jgi:hypothetical protein
VNGKKEFSNFEIQWAVRAQSIDRTIANGFHVLFNFVLSSSVRIFVCWSRLVSLACCHNSLVRHDKHGAAGWSTQRFIERSIEDSNRGR